MGNQLSLMGNCHAPEIAPPKEKGSRSLKRQQPRPDSLDISPNSRSLESPTLSRFVPLGRQPPPLCGDAVVDREVSEATQSPGWSSSSPGSLGSNLELDLVLPLMVGSEVGLAPGQEVDVDGNLRPGRVGIISAVD